MEEIENCEAVASSEVIIIDGKSNGVADVDDGKLRKSKVPRRSSMANWTEEEDDILEDAVKKYEGKCWKKIAECLPGRTNVQCLHRWRKVLNPDLIKGPWKKEEDILLIKLVEKFGDNGKKKWSKIAKELPGRMGKQCRERWYNHLNPEINKGPWTDEEENILINAHAEYGNKWSMIAKLLPGRTENSVKNHWNCTMKKRHDNCISIITTRVDSGSNERPKYSNEECASWSYYTGLCYEPIDMNTDITNIYLSSGIYSSMESTSESNGCGPSSSLSSIKESSADFFRRIKSMWRKAAVNFDMPSIIRRKRPKHALDEDASSNTSMHTKED